MADNDGTLRDLLSGFSRMQQSLGLLPGAQNAQGLQPISTPGLRHPGEISQQISMQMQQQSQALSQQSQQIRMLPPANVMGFMPAQGAGGGFPAGQDFSRQYQERMGQIQSGYQQPFQAQAWAQQMGGQGFLGMPSPISMTPPSMGAFRPGFQPPPPIGLARTPPMLQTPFTPQLPAPMFQTPYQMDIAQQQMGANQMFSGAMAGIPMGARMGMGLGGAALGAHLGGRLGPIGGALGAIGGGLLGFGPAGGLAEQGAEGLLQPAITRRAFGMQMQGMSRNFVVGGQDLDASGRGLSMQAGIGTANQMQRAVNKGETAGFNMRDMMGISSMAGDMGMMDMAQNSTQIVSQAKNIAKGLSAFMQLANEPDVRRAMQQMSQMRAMGLTIPETTAAMQNAQQFARMAGTTVASLGESAGRPGAMTFQQLGMTGGLGMQVGMGAGAMARQAVGAGAFTPGQLNMAGGVQGIGQQLMESAGANIGVTFPMMAMLTRNAQGQLAIDQEARQRIDSGTVSLTQQANMAQQNIERLGGASVITELSTRLNELRDELGRQRGPQGTILSTFTQALQMQKEIGGGMTFGGALKALGLGDQQARTLEVAGQSSNFWENMQRATQQQIYEARSNEAAHRERMKDTGSLVSQISRSFRPVGEALGGVGSAISGAYDDVSQWFTTSGRQAEAARRGETYVHETGRLSTKSAAASRAVSSFVGTAGYQRWAEGAGREEGRQDSRRAAMDRAAGYGEGPVAALTAGANLALGVFSGGLVSFDGPGAGMQSVRDRAVMGGLGGWAAENMPNFAGAVLAAKGTEGKWREEAEDVAGSAVAVQQSGAISSSAAVRMAREGEASFKEAVRGTEGEKTTLAAFKNKAVTSVLGLLRERSGVFAKPLKKSEAWAAIQKDAEATMGKERGAAWVEKNKESLLRDVYRDVGMRITDDTASSWAKTVEGGGITGATAGKNLQDVIQKLEAQEEDVEERLNLRAGFNVSEEGMAEYKDILMTSSADESLLLHALAAQDDDSGGWLDPTGKALSAKNRAQGARDIERLLNSGRLKPEAIEKMKKKYEEVKKDPEALKAFRRASLALGQMDPEKQREYMDNTGAGLKGRRGGLSVMKGAARLAEAGVTALQDLAKTGVKEGRFSKEGTIAAMEKIAGDESQLEALRTSSRAAYDAVMKFKAAGGSEEGRAGAAAAFVKGLEGVSKRGGDTYGGKGVGGAAEEGTKKELDTIERLKASLTGDAQGDFAKTVPVFAEASAKLDKSSERLDKVVDATVMYLKLKTSIW